MLRSDDMTATMLQVTLKDYVCSVCWGHLTEITQEGVRYVVCAKDHEHINFVKASYAERALLQSQEDKYEVRERLIKLGVIEPIRTGLTPEELIKELGYSND